MIQLTKAIYDSYFVKGVYLKMSKNIRKYVEVDKMAAELRQKEEVKRLEEQKQAKKIRIMELTNSLAVSYAHIRPTNIQGQRILKIFDYLSRQLGIVSRLPIDFSLCLQANALSSNIKNIFIRLIGLEAEITDITNELQEKKEALGVLLDEEDEEESDLQKRHDLEDSIDGKENALLDAEERYKEEIQELTRNLNIEDLNMLPISSEKIYTKTPQIFNSLYFIYLKKLSTSFEEEQGHKRLLKALNRSIGETQQLEKKTREDLEKLNNDRQNEIERKDNEIVKLKSELTRIVQNERDSLNIAQEESVIKKEARDNKHQIAMAQLTSKIHEQKVHLEQTEKINIERESELIKLKEDLEAQISMQINDIENLKQREEDKTKKILVT